MLPFRVSAFYYTFYNAILQTVKNIKTDLFVKTDFREWLSSKDASFYFALLQRYADQYDVGQWRGTSYHDFKYQWEKREDDCPNFSLCAKFAVLDESSSLLDNENAIIEHSILLPYAILDYYYGTNGMCAGNTKEEALVQGICEIIERYIQRRLILGWKEEIYDITDSCTQKMNSIDATSKLLKAHGYRIKVLECLTSFGVSVVAVILRKSDGAYYVSFGCHPDILIGVDRAINELFQGYCIDTIDIAFRDDYIIECSTPEAQTNYLNLLKYGVGKYPARLILGQFPKRDIQVDINVKSNKELLHSLIKTINKSGMDIFACRGLHMGLQTYHVIIPGISEAEHILPSDKIRSSDIKGTYANLSMMSKTEALRLAEHCNLLYASNSVTLESLLDIDKYSVYCGCKTSVKGISAALFIAMLYIKAERWGKAAFFLKKFIKELSLCPDIEEADMRYYQTFMIILEEKANSWSDDEVRDSLEIVDTDIDSILKTINCKDDLYSNLPQLSTNALLADSDTLRKAVERESKILKRLMGAYLDEKTLSNYIEKVPYSGETILFNKINGNIVLLESNKIIEHGEGISFLNCSDHDMALLEKYGFFIDDNMVQEYY